MSSDMPQLILSAPADRSLAAYQAWVRELAQALGGQDDDMTPEEWEADWRAFWADELPAEAPDAA